MSTFLLSIQMEYNICGSKFKEIILNLKQPIICVLYVMFLKPFCVFN